MRVVSESQLSTGEKPVQQPGLAEELFSIMQSIKAVDDLKVLNRSLTLQVATLTSNVDTLEKLVSQHTQYQKDHNQLHKNLDKAISALAIVIKSSSEVGVTSAASMQDANMQQHTSAIVSAIETMVSMYKEASMSRPASPRGDDGVEYDYKLIRGGNGLIDKVRETRVR